MYFMNSLQPAQKDYQQKQSRMPQHTSSKILAYSNQNESEPRATNHKTEVEYLVTVNKLRPYALHDHQTDGFPPEMRK